MKSIKSPKNLLTAGLISCSLASPFVSAQTPSPRPPVSSIEVVGEPISRALRAELEQVLARHPLRESFPPTIAFAWDPDWAGSAGFFSRDVRSPEGNPLITLSLRLRPESYFSIVGHELTHLAIAEMSPDIRPAGWFEEGLALLSEYHLTGAIGRSFAEAFFQPTVSLAAPLAFAAQTVRTDHLALLEALPAYGQALQFALYTQIHCASGDLLGAIYATQSTADQGAVGWWTAAGSQNPAAPAECRNFDSLFTEFQRARFRTGGILPTSSVATVITADRFPELPPYSSAAVALPLSVSCESQNAEELPERRADTGRHVCWRVQLEAPPPAEIRNPRHRTRRRGH